MKYSNLYYTSVESIHAPDFAVENAIKAAELRAAGMASFSAKTRCAAAAASVVIAGAAVFSVYNFYGKNHYPTAPASLSGVDYQPTEPETAEAVHPAETSVSSDPDSALSSALSTSAIEHDPQETVLFSWPTGPDPAPTVPDSAQPSVPKPTEPQLTDSTEPQSQIPTSIPTPPPVISPTEINTESPSHSINPTQPEHSAQPEQKKYCYAYMKSCDGALFCRIIDDSGEVIGDPDLFSSQHSVEIIYSYSNGYILAGWSPNEHGIMPPSGCYRYIFYNANGEELFTDYIYF